MSDKKEIKETQKEYTKVTSEGKIFIKTSDFFKIDKIQETINLFLESDLIKEIDKRKQPVDKIVS
ncbi:hypothetical protein U6A24_17365 [Aquimarina gracilis]|uniref:Uncharacterized protein n=1 Tax=Aquimarina gracilis TaxID=874422 RepID=A0ABU5ZZC9_9FLAO|nr:hypothetical protein [Aquimarina gracilis]MEB3347248.1 hypothetical protein [Aquimarina gracilis]